LDAAETERFVGDLEIAVDRLRSLYEQYFMGIEKLEPTVPRKDVDRRIHVLRKEQIRNTAQRFRFQMILQKYNTYQTHWMRICREIENGTYKRHLLKAKQRFGEDPQRASNPAPEPVATPAAAKAPALPAHAPPLAQLAQPGVVAKRLAAELAELDEDFAPMLELDDDELEAVDDRPAAARKPAGKTGPIWRKAEPAAPRSSQSPPPPAPPDRAPSPTAPTALTQARAAPRPAPVAALPPRAATAVRPVAPPSPAERPASELPEERVRQLYAQYVETKRQQRESTAAITFEAVAKSLRESSAKLREKHGKSVDFEVSVKDGKTILKPVLK
jgi:hypothetical protein